ncbi:HAMP domain-containing histidine kinase, partial [Candidatus Binatia bacterium]|nr:HAMP domain-containing histidine kinase [Candidatus Binatia bacterium]
MTLRARLTLLFLAAVQATFLCAVAAYWAVTSWRVLFDEMAHVPEQTVRIDRLLDAVAGATATGTPPRDDRAVQSALARLERHAQTQDEARAARRVASALGGGDRERLRRAVHQLRDHHRAELRREQRRARELARISDGLVLGIVVVVTAGFLGFLAAMRAWLVEPVRALERGMKIMSTGDLAHRIAPPGSGELARLARGINQMAASLAGIQEQMLARERFALLGELGAYVAHNIRNPLASIRATAQGELVDLATGDPRREAFADIVHACDRLAAWVTDLLRSASPVVLERREGRIDEMVARCAALARPRLAQAGVEMALSLAETAPVAFDEAKLEQVVSAVLANAIDASPP